MVWNLAAPMQTLIPLPTSAAQIGGTPAVLKYLLERNLIDGSCLTVTGATGQS